MEDDTDKTQCRQNTPHNDDDCSAGSGNMVSLLPSGTKSEEKKSPEETDDCGIAAAASNKANTDNANSSRDLSMPWVKDLPVHLLAAFFQRMPPLLKRQVEMTTQRMAKIMKVHGWRKYDSIDIVIPADSSGSFRVNDSIDVKIGDVFDCVQLLLSRIRVRRFSMKHSTDDDDPDPYDDDPDPYDDDPDPYDDDPDPYDDDPDPYDDDPDPYDDDPDPYDDDPDPYDDDPDPYDDDPDPYDDDPDPYDDDPDPYDDDPDPYDDDPDPYDDDPDPYDDDPDPYDDDPDPYDDDPDPYDDDPDPYDDDPDPYDDDPDPYDDDPDPYDDDPDPYDDDPDPYDDDSKPDREMMDAMNAIMDALLKSKDDGVAIRELRLDVPSQLLKSSTLGQVITAFSDTLTHVLTPKLDEIATDAIEKCDHLEALAFARLDATMSYCPTLDDNPLKDALAAKWSLTSLSLEYPLFNPFDILTVGVHHLKHLAIEGLTFLEMAVEPTADQKNLLSTLELLEIDGFSYSSDDMDNLLNVLQDQVAPELKRLHIIGPGNVSFTDDFFEPDPGDVSSFVRDLADECLRNRRSLIVSARFKLSPQIDENNDGEVAANDDQGMLATMMEYDKEFVTSPNLSQYGVMAFDERLHAFDANLIPPTTESPPQITTIDGSRVYKRQFTIDVMPGVRLFIAFDESLEMEVDEEYESDEEDEFDEEDEYYHPEMCPCDVCNEEPTFDLLPL